MTAVGITENVKGDAKKFEIWYNAREEVYIIQVQPLTCPENQEPREPLSLFRVTSENQVNHLREVHPPGAGAVTLGRFPGPQDGIWEHTHTGC